MATALSFSGVELFQNCWQLGEVIANGIGSRVGPASIAGDANQNTKSADLMWASDVFLLAVAEMNECLGWDSETGRRFFERACIGFRAADFVREDQGVEVLEEAVMIEKLA